MVYLFILILLHSERPKLYTILAFLSAVGLNLNLPQQPAPDCSMAYVVLATDSTMSGHGSTVTAGRGTEIGLYLWSDNFVFTCHNYSLSWETIAHGRMHGAPYSGHAYVSLRFGENVLMIIGTQQQQRDHSQLSYLNIVKYEQFYFFVHQYLVKMIKQTV